MPKMKTHSGTKKRIKKTGSGKIKVPHTNKGHLLSNKSKSAKRRNKHEFVMSSGDVKRLKQILSNIK
jgi:large subunit ribosomal protein L35